MDYVFEKKWNDLLESLKENFGPLDFDSLLFLVGLQELGMEMKKLTKDQKLDVLHIAICTVLEPYGIYSYTHRDDDGWPHYERTKKMPFLGEKEQERLIKEALIKYFEAKELLD